MATKMHYLYVQVNLFYNAILFYYISHYVPLATHSSRRPLPLQYTAFEYFFNGFVNDKAVDNPYNIVRFTIFNLYLIDVFVVEF